MVKINQGLGDGSNDSDYISEALKLIKEQKGLNKSKTQTPPVPQH